MIPPCEACQQERALAKWSTEPISPTHRLTEDEARAIRNMDGYMPIDVMHKALSDAELKAWIALCGEARERLK